MFYDIAVYSLLVLRHYAKIFLKLTSKLSKNLVSANHNEVLITRVLRKLSLSIFPNGLLNYTIPASPEPCWYRQRILGALRASDIVTHIQHTQILIPFNLMYNTISELQQTVIRYTRFYLKKQHQN